MRIILCGKNESAVQTLEWLVEQGDDIWVIVTKADDGYDGWQRSLAKRCLELDVPFEQPEKINDPSLVARLADNRPDVLVSIQYDQILKEPLFRVIGCPCLNIHYALLPRHRGVAPIAWAVFQGDAEAGVTLHQMIPQVDAGAIIAQRATPIDPGHTARDIYEVLTILAVELFQQCYPFDREILRDATPQAEQFATYHRQGKFDFSDRRIAWDRPANELHRWIRAMIFPPLQYPELVLNGKVWHVQRVGAKIDRCAASPGEVVLVSKDRVACAALGGMIEVRGVQDPSDSSRGLPELAAEIAVGMKLD